MRSVWYHDNTLRISHYDAHACERDLWGDPEMEWGPNGSHASHSWRGVGEGGSGPERDVKASQRAAAMRDDAHEEWKRVR